MNDAGIPQHIQKALAVIAEVAPDLAGRIAAVANARPERRPLDGADRALLASCPADARVRAAIHEVAQFPSNVTLS